MQMIEQAEYMLSCIYLPSYVCTYIISMYSLWLVVKRLASYLAFIGQQVNIINA